MQVSDGRQYFGVGLDLTQLRQGASEARSLLHGIGQQAVSEGSEMDAVFNRMRNTVAGVFAVSQIKDFIGQVISTRGEIQSMEVAFRTLLGNQEKADAMFSEIRKFAVSTPMMMKDLASGAQQMLAFGIESDRIMPMLRALGDVSMGNSQKFQSLTLAFSQMSATGKLMGQDLLQMINAGFNPLQVIAEQTGKSIGELKEEMSKGAISADMVAEAFIAATSEGGKFHNMLRNMSGGVEGQMSNLQGAIDDMMNDLGEQLQGAVSAATTAATFLVQHYEPLLTILGTLVATYGTYKAALMVNAAVESVVATNRAKGLAAIEAEIAAVGTRTATETIATDAHLAEAVAKGRLTKAEALHIMSLKGEAAARVQALEAAAAQAKADLAAAAAAEHAAMVRLQAAEQQEAIAMRQLALAEAQGDAFVVATAKEEVNTAANVRNAASKEYQAAAATKDAAARVADTAATEANTAATALNTAGMRAGIAQAGIFRSALNLLNGGLKAVAATMMAHPYAAVAAAVVALGVAVYKLATYETEAEKTQRMLNDAIADAATEATREKNNLDLLKKTLETTNKESEAYMAAKESIVNQYGKYLKGLIDEKGEIIDLEAAYVRLTEAITNSANARAMSDVQKNASEKRDETLKDSINEIADILNDGMDENTANTLMAIIRREYDQRGMISTTTEDTIAGLLGEERLKNGKWRKDSSVVKIKAAIADMRKAQSDYDRTINSAQAKFAAQENEYSSWSKEDLELAKQQLKDSIETGETVDILLYLNGRLVKKYKDVHDARLAMLKMEDAIAASTPEQVSAEPKKETDETPKTLKTQEKNDADRLAARAIEQKEAIRQYGIEVANAARQAEFEIEQTRIDAMDEGLQRTLDQNTLNYKKLKEQNRLRAEEMVAELRNAMQAQWEMENPDATETQKAQHRVDLATSITGETLDPNKLPEQFRTQAEQIVDMVNKYEQIAAQAFNESNKNALAEALSDVQTYAQQREKIQKDYANREEALYTHDAQGNRTGLREGVTQGNVDELQRQRDEALTSVDEQFASREEEYQAWCTQITNWTLDQLESMLDKVEAELQEMEDDGDVDDNTLARFRAMRSQLKKQKNKKTADDKLEPGKRTIEEWQDLYNTLNDVRGSFEEIGETVGGVVGDIISECGKMAASTLSMINSIVQLANWSTISTQRAAQGASAAILTVEKASVILTIITAAMQIAMQIANLFNDDKKKQKEIEALQDRIDQLQWELDNAEIMRSRKLAEGGTYLAQMKKLLAETRNEMIRLGLATHNWRMVMQAAWGRVSSNTNLMSATVDKLAKAYGNMAYTADKAIGAEKYKSANDQLKNIAQQQLLIQEQIDIERSKKKTDNAAIADYERKIEELGQQALEIINDMVEDIIGDSSTGIAEKLANAFFDAFAAGEDAAEAWGDKVNEIVGDILRRMMVQKFLEEPLGQIFNRYKAKWFPNGEFAGMDAVINSMTDFANDLNGELADFQTVMNALPDELRQYFIDKIEDERSASQGGIATASQESVDELNGRATAIQGHTYSISENTKTLVANTTSILASVMNIESNTGVMAQDLVAIHADIKNVRASVDHIQMHGLKLTN